jgi:hypothetical protein
MTANGLLVTRAEAIGPTSLVYGDKTMGLLHIAVRRGLDFLEKLPAVLKEGSVYSQTGVKDRGYLGHSDREAVVRLDWNGRDRPGG